MRNLSVNAYDIALLLRDNYHNVYSSDLKDLIQAFDANHDNKLDAIELQNVILTATDKILRNRAQDRREHYIGHSDKLPVDVEYRLARFLNLEIQGLK